MREEKILVKIKNDGTVAIEVLGVKGVKCVDITKELEEELGVVTKQTKKQAFHQRPVKQTTQKVSRVHRDKR